MLGANSPIHNPDGQSPALAAVTEWDGWRGLAILLVLVGHFFNHATEFILEDRLGVDIFFVLSGMLMSRILFERRMKLGDFYIRRASRILPAMYAYVFVTFLAARLVEWRFQPAELVSTLTFLRMYLPPQLPYWTSEAPVGHLWSLYVEEHAYILMSAISIVVLGHIRSATALLSVGLVSMAIACFYYVFDTSPVYDRRTESAVVFIMLSAGYSLLRSHLAIRSHPMVPLATLALAALCYIEPLPDWMRLTFAPVLLAYTINHLTEAHGVLLWIFRQKALRLLGVWSFSLYLWQQPFYANSWWFPGGEVTALVVALGAGVASYYLLETPIRQFINNRFSPAPYAGTRAGSERHA